MTARALGYIRVSTDQQAASGLGIDAQAAAIVQAARRLALPLAGLYRDEGYSGTMAIAQRPGLLDAIQALQKGDVLLVAKRDRLARDPLLSLLIDREVRAKKARIVSAAGEGTEADDPTSQLLRTVLDGVAQFERAMIAARTRAALQAKRARGERAGTVRFGFQLAADGRHVEPNPDEQRTLAVLHDCRAAGYSQQATANELNRRGLLTRKGGVWFPQYIASLERTQATV